MVDNVTGACGKETPTKHRRIACVDLPGHIKFLKTLQILKERILVNSIKQEYTIQQANYYLERKAATAA